MEKERRNCCEVIQKMIEKVPADQTELIKDLQWNYDDASYKAPEEVIQWRRTLETLQKHMNPLPEHDWEFEVLAIFIDDTVETVREMARRHIEESEKEKQN